MTDQIRTGQPTVTPRTDDPALRGQADVAPEVVPYDANAAHEEEEAKKGDSGFDFQGLRDRLAGVPPKPPPTEAKKGEASFKDGRIKVKKDIDVAYTKAKVGSFGKGDIFKDTVGADGKSTSGPLAKVISKAEYSNEVALINMGSAGFKVKGAEAGISGTVLALKNEGSHTASLKEGAVKVEFRGSGSATVVDVSGRVKIGSDAVGVEAAGRAYLGAEGKYDGTVVIDPKKKVFAAKVNGEAFVGARVGGEAKVSLGKYGSAGVKGDALAGVGAMGAAEIGLKGGKLKIKAEIGAVVALGLKGGVDIDVDVGAMAKDAREAVTRTGQAVTTAVANSSVGKATTQLATDAAKTAAAAATTVVNSDTGKAVIGTAKKAMASEAGKVATAAAASVGEAVSGAFGKITGMFSSAPEVAKASAAAVGATARAAA